MKLFYLVRDRDVSGVSGTGVVAEGVIYHNGKVSMCWRADTNSIAIYDSIQVVEEIHGHNGKTKILHFGEYQ